MKYIVIFVSGGIGLLIAHLYLTNMTTHTTDFPNNLYYFGVGILMCWVDSKL